MSASVHEAAERLGGHPFGGSAGGIAGASGHDHQMLERLCARAIHLEKGAVHADGPFAEVQPAYRSDVELEQNRLAA